MAIKHQNGAVCGCSVHLLQQTPAATITPAINGWKKRIVLWLQKPENERSQGDTKKPDGEKQNQGKILVHQPAAPRAFTTIVFVLNREDWTEN